jgi:adenosylcobinamide kinase/adenosylcobinamide-phosphate guanylyltransferase
MSCALFPNPSTLVFCMGRIFFITGGARSGKSRFAEHVTAELGTDITYIATAHALDAEMEERVRRHRQQRPACWQTFEAPLSPAAVIAAQGEQEPQPAAFLLDCLTVLTSNRILAHTVDWEHPSIAQLQTIEADILSEIAALIAATQAGAADLVAVGNEVGYGIVPPSPLARFFRDCAGRVNQQMAAAASEVYLVVAGIPMQIKGSAVPR